MKKTALEKIVAYLKGKKKGATAPEIAHYAKVNYNTVRRVLGEIYWSTSEALESNFKKCRITGKQLTSYKLA